MDSIKLMMEEHKYIKRMLVVVRKASIKVMQEDKINYDDFEKIISFVRNYADAHHHAKEEKILFTRMVDEMGDIADIVVKHGMLVEHDLGRLFIRDLEEALARVKNGDEDSKVDVIANAVSYTHLLNRHIDKEDKVTYPFAQRGLTKTSFDKIDEECEKYEAENAKKKIQVTYIALLEELEKKYL